VYQLRSGPEHTDMSASNEAQSTGLLETTHTTQWRMPVSLSTQLMVTPLRAQSWIAATAGSKAVVKANDVHVTHGVVKCSRQENAFHCESKN